MQSSEFFAYSWHIDENETNVTIIRVYGLNAQNENVCVIVPNFTPYIYVELPDHIQWTDGKLEPILERIRKASTDCPPVKMALQYKKRLYYAHLDKDGKRKLFPYLFLAFSHINDVKKISGFFRRPMNIFGLGELHFKVHENNASPILQLTSLRKIPTAGWISFTGKRVTDETEKITRCKFEYKVRWQNLSEKITEKVARPLMMGWDIEVYSSNPSAMPRAHKPEDKVFQISCVFARQGDSPNLWERYLLTLKKPDEKTEIKIEDAKVLVFDTEDQLFLGYVDLMQKKQPNIIIGYNIFQFDINYMVQRSKEILMNIDKFDRQGLDKYGHAKERIIEWDSSAYKNQSFQFLDAEGRIFVDLLPIIKRDHKLSNYQLKTVALEFLKDMTKDPLDHKAIFKCYRIGMTGGLKGSQALSLVGKYCIKDSELVVRLFEKLTCWIALCEMSKVTNVPIFALFTQGQQLKVFSQIYKKCCHENIVVERDGYISKEDEHYIGATVFPPTPGVYDKVVPFDFCLTGDTRITMWNNTTKRLDEIQENEEVLGYGENGFAPFRVKGNLQRKGVKNIIKILLSDGTTIKTTPEHKFMLNTGEWCEAQYLEGKYVKNGISGPCKEKEETKWSFKNFTFEESLIIARILGYVLTDGCLYFMDNRLMGEVYLGSYYDALTMKKDLTLFTSTDLKIAKRISKMKGITFRLSIPSKLTVLFESLSGIIIGKRSTQKMDLPHFLFSPDCPKNIIKEFLGGLYGGDGSAPYYINTNRIGNIALKWTTIERHLQDMISCMEKLKFLHDLIGINTTISNPIKIKYSNTSIRPKDFEINPRWDCQINVSLADMLNFQNQIGFRYCINKIYRSYICSNYCQMQNITRNQHSKVVNKTIELFEKTRESVKKCLEKARISVFQEDFPISPCSLSSVYDIGYRKHEKIRHADKPQKLSLSAKKFQTFYDFLVDTKTVDWFNTEGTKKYVINQDELYIPSFQKKVIKILQSDPEEVYDIEVDQVHNFLANGVVVHNCSLYPTSIIATNIDYSTLVPEDSKIPDEKCNVLEWEEHVGCEHDPRVVRKKEIIEILKKMNDEMKEIRKQRDLKKNKDRKPEYREKLEEFKERMRPLREEKKKLSESKNKFCGKRKYKFLKEPMGVLPEILTYLLEARSKTKKEMKGVKKKLEEMDPSNPEYIDTKTLLEVLDKRQNAFKISANSGYGAMGVKRGALPFMPGAMCTTYVGRKAIEKASSVIQKDYGGVLIYGDSVSGDTPILIKYENDSIDVKTIDTIGKNWEEYDQFKCDQNLIGKEQSIINGVSVWTDKGWSKIRRVIRHKTTKKMYRVLTHTGCVDVTEDHSLLTKNREQVKPEDVKIGDELLHSFPSTFEEFDTTIIDSEGQNQKEKIDPVLWGYFFLYGKIQNETWYLPRKYIKLNFQIEGDNYISKNKRLISEYHQLFYDKNKRKIVPYPVLNDNDLKYSFLAVIANQNEYYQDKITAQGIYTLWKSIGLNATILYDSNGYKIVQLDENKSNIQKIISLSHISFEENIVYDLETEEGVFQAGIGELIVKNTDSNYVSFPTLKTAQECWDYSVKVASEVTKLYPKPMALAFEEKIYWRFLILTKKRYMCLSCERDGKISNNISKKGVLLNRRDNSEIIRNIYGNVILDIFNKKPIQDILNYIIDELNKICSFSYPWRSYVITKEVGDDGDLVLGAGKDKSGKECYKVGDYKINARYLLSSDAKEREKQLEAKDAGNAKEYYLKCLPAQVQLAHRMKVRGNPVAPGTRLEFVITSEGGQKALQAVKNESADYFARHSDVLRIDFMYYIKQLANPLDQVLEIIFKDTLPGKRDFVLNQYKYRSVVRDRVLRDIEKLFKPKLVFP